MSPPPRLRELGGWGMRNCGIFWTSHELTALVATVQDGTCQHSMMDGGQGYSLRRCWQLIVVGEGGATFLSSVASDSRCVLVNRLPQLIQANIIKVTKQPKGRK